MAARYQAQQIGEQQGFQRAINQMSSYGMGPMIGPMGQVMGPTMGPTMGPMVPMMVPMGAMMGPPMGGFGGPYQGSYGGSSAFGNPGWGSQRWGGQFPGQFGQQQIGGPTPPMGQVWATSGRGASGRPGNGRKLSKGKKGVLAAGSAGVEKSTSKSAKLKAKRNLKAAQAKRAEDASSLPVDHELLAGLAAINPDTANDAEVQDIPALDDGAENPPREGTGIAPVTAESLIAEVRNRYHGFDFPQDESWVRQQARWLALHGQPMLQRYRVAAAANGSSVLWEAFQEY